MLVIAGVLASVWWFTSFEPRNRDTREKVIVSTGDRADDVGRTAGRLVGRGVNAWRRRKGASVMVHASNPHESGSR